MAPAQHVRRAGWRRCNDARRTPSGQRREIRPPRPAAWLPFRSPSRLSPASRREARPLPSAPYRPARPQNLVQEGLQPGIVRVYSESPACCSERILGVARAELLTCALFCTSEALVSRLVKRLRLGRRRRLGNWHGRRWTGLRGLRGPGLEGSGLGARERSQQRPPVPGPRPPNPTHGLASPRPPVPGPRSPAPGAWPPAWPQRITAAMSARTMLPPTLKVLDCRTVDLSQTAAVDSVGRSENPAGWAVGPGGRARSRSAAPALRDTGRRARERPRRAGSRRHSRGAAVAWRPSPGPDRSHAALFGGSLCPRPSRAAFQHREPRAVGVSERTSASVRRASSKRSLSMAMPALAITQRRAPPVRGVQPRRGRVLRLRVPRGDLLGLGLQRPQRFGHERVGGETRPVRDGVLMLPCSSCCSLSGSWPWRAARVPRLVVGSQDGRERAEVFGALQLSFSRFERRVAAVQIVAR